VFELSIYIESLYYLVSNNLGYDNEINPF
jgi:hypothetical protein